MCVCIYFLSRIRIFDYENSTLINNLNKKKNLYCSQPSVVTFATQKKWPKDMNYGSLGWRGELKKVPFAISKLKISVEITANTN